MTTTVTVTQPVSVTVTKMFEWYCVDATNGNDANTGTTADPWKTIDKVNSSTFDMADCVMFKCGETWREQLNIPSSGAAGLPITFSSYGTGDKPKIYGSNVPASWTQESALYYTAQTVDPLYIWFIATDTTIHNGNKVAAKGDLAADYDWWWDDPNDRLYIYAASDPLARYTSVEVCTPARTRGIFWTGSGNSNITVNNFEIAFITGVALVARGDNWIITNNHIHHLGNQAGGHSYGVELQTGINSYVGYNTIYEMYRAGIYVVASYTPYISTGHIVEHNTVYNCAAALLLANTEALTDTFTTTIIRYNHFYHEAGYSIGAGNGYGIDLVGQSGHVLDGYQIYYNVVYSQKRAINVYDYATNIIVYNNTIKSISGIAGLYVSGTGTSGITIKNNIVLDAATYGLDILDSTAITACDYNLWYCPTGTVYAVVNGSSYHSNDFAAYQAATGFDTNGKWENPVTVSASDLHLQTTSPAKNAGVNVGLSLDYDGITVPQGAAPDMGAYEYH